MNRIESELRDWGFRAQIVMAIVCAIALTASSARAK